MINFLHTITLFFIGLAVFYISGLCPSILTFAYGDGRVMIVDF